VASEDQESKTEQPSSKKLGKAYAAGQFPIGHDAILVAVTGTCCLTLAIVGGVLRNGLVALLRSAAGSVDRTPFRSLLGQAAAPGLALLWVCLAAGGAGILATLVQTKGQVPTERPLLDLGRVVRGFSGLSRIFRKDFALDLLLALGKAIVIASAVWPSARRDLVRLPELLTAEPGAQLSAGFQMLLRAARPAFGALLVLAAAEWALARYRFFRDQRMTKQEMRDEVRDEEGDAQIKSRRRQRARQQLRNRARVEVPRADALVVNPTHVAVAIRYRRLEGRAPRVTAKGKGVLAEHMRELARENGVAIVENIPLARFLYRKVKVGGEVPAQTYKAVAAILAFVYRLSGRREEGTRA